MFRNIVFFLRWGIVSASPNPCAREGTHIKNKPVSRDYGQLSFAGALHHCHLDTLYCERRQGCSCERSRELNEVWNVRQRPRACTRRVRSLCSHVHNSSRLGSLYASGILLQCSFNMHSLLVCTVFQLIFVPHITLHWLEKATLLLVASKEREMLKDHQLFIKLTVTHKLTPLHNDKCLHVLNHRKLLAVSSYSKNITDFSKSRLCSCLCCQ